MTNRWSTMNHRLILAVAALTLAATSVGAQESPNHIGTFRDWEAYETNSPEGKLCYAASQPTDSTYSQPISSRGPVFFMVTAIPSKNVPGETSTIIGYPFKESSSVTVDVDGQVFSMYTESDAAWVEAPANDPVLIDAMRRGRSMSVKGMSKRGTVSVDTYSLSGITAALQAVTRACGS